MIGVSYYQSLFAMVKEQDAKRMSVNHRKTMSWLSRAIELTALKANGTVRIFSGFQSMQFFLPVRARYEQLAEQGAQVFVYGYPDIVPPMDSRITYVQLDKEDPLVKEWFIVVNSPDFSNALLTEDESGLNTPHERRRFKGLLSYDRDMVQGLDDALSSQIRVPHVQPSAMSALERQMMMLMVENLQDASRRMMHDATVTRELGAITNQYISPALNARLSPASTVATDSLTFSTKSRLHMNQTV